MKFRSQISDNMDRWKAEMGRVREEKRRRKKKRVSLRRKKIQVREKVAKSRNIVFFQWFVAPEGRKVGSLNGRVRSQLARWEIKNCTPLWREARFQVKMYKTNQVRTTFWSWDDEKVDAVLAWSKFPSQNVQSTPGSDHFLTLSAHFPFKVYKAHQVRTTFLTLNTHFQVKVYKAHQVRSTFGSWDVQKVYAVVAQSTSRSQKCKNCGIRTAFGSWDVEKVHAVVARSTFPSQIVQSTPGSDHFWKLTCGKSARRCGAKHVSKSKCTKQTRFGPLFEVEMMKKWMPFWREANFQVKMYKAHQVRTTFWRWTHISLSKCTKHTRFGPLFWRWTHISKSKCTKHTRFEARLEVEMSKKCTPLWRKAHLEVKSAKTVGFGPLLEVEMLKKCTPLWREAHFQVKLYKAPGSDHFWKLTCGKSARRCGAKHISKSKVQKLWDSDRFWKLRCWKSARRCGAKHISKSNCTKHTRFGPLLEVDMWKKCTPLWRKAHFQVKMLNATCSDHFWRFRCRFAWQAQWILHCAKSEQNVRVLWHV